MLLFSMQAAAMRGGVSFRTPQNMPKSWMASKKALKSTGLTTKAFTPSS